MTGKYLSRIFSSRGSFSLKKLYIDCIDEKGNCIIIYLAVLNYRFLRLFYSSSEYSGSDGLILQSTCWQRHELPDADGILEIDMEKPGIKGRWKACERPISLPVYTSAHNGGVFWNCHHPKATADIAVNGIIIRGLGYAETLSVTAEPWNLPLDELKWGRYLSEKHTIIWISWQGKHNYSRVFLDGTEYYDPLFLDDRLVFGGNNVLRFDEVFLIREGKTGDLVRNSIVLKLLLKRSVFDIGERKEKARSTYSNGSGIIDNGWSLYETVSWKN